MSPRDLYDKFLESSRNPTKLSILMLLTRHEKMTVTQMAKRVGVTKSNLYHFAAELVRDGFLATPEARVTKNYVEKYYSLNEDAFKALDPVEQQRRIQSGSLAGQRSLLTSFFATLSLFFRLQAEEIARMDSKSLSRLIETFKSGRASISYSILPDEAFDFLASEIRKMSLSILQRWGGPKENTKKLRQGNVAVFVALPSLPVMAIANHS